MDIPKIGETKGIFEVFLPGAFLFSHIIAFIVVLLYPIDKFETTSAIFNKILNNSFFVVLVFISFSYLLGVFLRLLRPGGLDFVSGFLVYIFQKKNRDMVRKSKKFPYIPWIEELCLECYNKNEIKTFFEKVWKDNLKSKYNRQFFNYCKNIIYFNNKDSAKEIFSAEAMTRFLTGICYALFISTIAIVICLFLITSHTSYKNLYDSTFIIGLLFCLVLYILVFLVLLINFRITRIKEVETVFISTFNNRELF